jgi:hypothetical protein
LKGKEQEIMKIAFEVLDEMLDEDFEPEEDEYDEISEEYIKYIVEKQI